MQLLTKTWFIYSIALYSLVAIALTSAYIPQCRITNATTTKAVRTANQSLSATAVFAMLSSVSLIVWWMVRYTVLLKQNREHSMSTLSNEESSVRRVSCMMACFNSSHRSAPASAEEVMCVVVTSFFTWLMRICAFVALVATTTLCRQWVGGGGSHTAVSALIFYIILFIGETLISITYFYYTIHEDDADEGSVYNNAV